MINQTPQKQTAPTLESLRSAESIASQGVQLSAAAFSELVNSILHIQRNDFREKQLAEIVVALQAAQDIAKSCFVEQIVVARFVRDCFSGETTTVESCGDVLTVERGYHAGGEMISYKMAVRRNSEGVSHEQQFLGAVGSTDSDKEFIGRIIEEISETLRLKQRGEQIGGDLRLPLLAKHVQGR